MEEFNIVIPPELMVIIPVVAWVIQQLKETPAAKYLLPWMKFFSLGLGLVFSILINGNFNVNQTVIPGIVVGIMATGSYEMMKVRNKKEVNSEIEDTMKIPRVQPSKPRPTPTGDGMTNEG